MNWKNCWEEAPKMDERDGNDFMVIAYINEKEVDCEPTLDYCIGLYDESGTISDENSKGSYITFFGECKVIKHPVAYSFIKIMSEDEEYRKIAEYLYAKLAKED